MGSGERISGFGGFLGGLDALLDESIAAVEREEPPVLRASYLPRSFGAIGGGDDLRFCAACAGTTGKLDRPVTMHKDVWHKDMTAGDT